MIFIYVVLYLSVHRFSYQTNDIIKNNYIKKITTILNNVNLKISTTELDIPYFVYFRILRSDDERGLTTDKKKARSTCT